MSTSGAHPARPIDSTAAVHTRPQAPMGRITASFTPRSNRTIGMAGPTRPGGRIHVARNGSPTRRGRSRGAREGALDGGRSPRGRGQPGTGGQAIVVDDGRQRADDDERSPVFDRVRVGNADPRGDEEDDVVVVAVVPQPARSEERRVGKEWRARWGRV